MWSYLARRAAWSLVTLLLLVTVVFFAAYWLFPYDPAAVRGTGLVDYRVRGCAAQPVATADGLARGYVAYLAGLVRGDLGVSATGCPVSTILGHALPFTILVFVVGATVAWLFGSWLGRIIAWQRRRTLAAATTTVGVLAYTAFPPWLAFLLVYWLTDPLFAARRAVGLPVDSARMWTLSAWQPQPVLNRMSATLLLALLAGLLIRRTLRKRGWWRTAAVVALPVPIAVAVTSWSWMGFGAEAVDLLFRTAIDAHIGRGSLLLVLLAFVVLAFGEVSFVTRTTVDAERDQPYVTTARAKGLDQTTIREHHVNPNTTMPALTRLFTSVPYLLTALIIIEHEFAMTGISTVLFGAVEAIDTPVIIGTLVTIGAVVLLLRLALETAHAWIDPRIRFTTPR
jgi:ABC-type dipeptide/oligopeptide/nickel transport system permease component